MLGWFAPKCPLDTLEKAWVERRMLWLAHRFGIARMRNAAVILPTEEFFPDQYDADEASARKCLDRICKYMGIDPSTIAMKVRDDDDLPGAAGLYQMRERSQIIIARSQLEYPPRLLATIAHELAHELLLKGGHITSEVADHEHVTDLLPVFLGTGIFLANATVVHSSVNDGPVNVFRISKHGYLSSITLGYALALFAYVRGETTPPWLKHLRTDAAATLKAGLRFLRRTGDSLFSPESADQKPVQPLPEDVALGLSHTSPTFRIASLWDIEEYRLTTATLLPALTRCLSDRNPGVQREAVRVLGKFGSAAAEAVPQLIEAAWYGELSIRIAAIGALGEINGNPQDIVPALATVLADTEPEIVRSAAYALSRYGRSAAPAEDQLLAALQSAAALNDESRIEYLVAALRTIGPNVRGRILSHFAGRDREGLRIVIEILRMQEQSAPNPTANEETREAAKTIVTE